MKSTQKNGCRLVVWFTLILFLFEQIALATPPVQQAPVSQSSQAQTSAANSQSASQSNRASYQPQTQANTQSFLTSSPLSQPSNVLYQNGRLRPDPSLELKDIEEFPSHPADFYALYENGNGHFDSINSHEAGIDFRPPPKRVRWNTGWARRKPVSSFKKKPFRGRTELVWNFDNPGTKRKTETADFSANDTLVFGLKGKVAVAQLSIQDKRGEEITLALEDVSPTKDTLYEIDISEISKRIDISKIRNIRLEVLMEKVNRKSTQIETLNIFYGLLKPDTTPPQVTRISPEITASHNYLLELEIDGKPYQENIQLQEGGNLIERTFTDRARNLTVWQDTITSDTISPSIQIISGSLVNNPVYTLLYTVDGIQKSEARSLVEGQNTLLVRGKDLVGNETILTHVVILDTVAPVIQITSPLLVNNSNYNLTYLVDGIQKTVPKNLNEGINSILISETDAASNQTQVSIDIVLDTTPPQINLVSSPISNRQNYILQYLIDGILQRESVHLNDEGLNAFQRTFADPAGNQANIDFQITLDSIAPVVDLISSTFVNNPNYFLAYNVDGARTQELIVLTEGRNFIPKRVVDAAGNATTKTFEVVLDSQPPVLAQMSINQGAATTKSSSVNLTLASYDLGSQVTEMSFSNDGVNFSLPEPFSTSKTWNLEESKGNKTVWVKLKDASGFWSNPTSASIVYEKIFLIDDFDGQTQVSTYWDMDGGIVYQRSFEQGQGIDGTSAMQVNFTKDAFHNYSFFALEPLRNGVANDFSAYRTLRFQLKKNHEPPMALLVKLEFEGTSEVYETQVQFPQGSGEWQEAIFDFSSVDPNKLKDVKKVLFFADPGNGNSQGSFLIDNLILDERTPTHLVDDFDGNSSSIQTYWDWDATTVYRREVTEEKAYDGTHSMKVEYTKLPGYSYSFFAFNPKQDGQSNNFTAFGSLRFQINKNFDSPMSLMVKLEFNGFPDTFESQLQFPQGSGSWQEATFDFSSVRPDLLANVKSVLFFADPASETTAGTFYIDRIRLAEAPSTRLLDDFDGNNSFIQTYWDVDGPGTVYTRSIDNTQSFDGTHSMKVEYNKSTNFPTSFFAFAPKQDDVSNDFSKFNVLKLRVKKESIPAMKLMMKFDLEGTQINFESWKEIPQGSSDWVELAYDFSSLDPVILKKVRAVLFFVDPAFFSMPTNSQGAFWIDSMRLDYENDLPARQLDPQNPPQLGWLNSSVASDMDNEYRLGSLVRINAWELNAAGDLLDASVRIVSQSTGYDSGEQKLVFLHDGQFWPFHWDTQGLQVADDYGVIVTLRDKSGNVTVVGSESQPALTIKLTQTVPPAGTLLSFNEFSVPFGQSTLGINRSYDPSDAEVFDRQLGLGWHSNLDYFIQDFPDGTVSLGLGDSGYEFFFRNPDGSYRPQSKSNYSTLLKNPQGGFFLQLKDGTIYEFDSAPFIDHNTVSTVTWFITRIWGPAGEIRFFYDVNRNLTSVNFPSGDSIQLEYSFREKDQFNTNKYNLDKITDASGGVWLYEHDVKGRLISATNPLGEKTNYEYDSKTRLTRIIYPDGSTEGYEYDGEGRIIKEFRNGVVQRQYVYGGRNVLAYDEIDALGRTTTYKFSSEGLLTETIDALGGITRNVYDSKHNLILQTDSQNRVSRFTYDQKGNLLQAIDASGAISRYTYEPVFNQMTSFTDALGNRAEFEYDINRQLIRVQDPAGNSTEYTYNLDGTVESAKDAKGNITTYISDSRGFPTLMRDAAGNIWNYQYDARGNLVSASDPARGQTELNQYDALGRIISHEDALGRRTQYAYDSMGHVTQITDPLGNISSFEYNNKGEKTAEVDVLGSRTSLNYDAVGNLISRRDALGNVTTFAYDAMNRLTEIRDALGRVTRFDYDLLGRKISETDALGHSTRFEYDAVGKLIKTIYPNGGEERVQYDLLGRILSRIDPLGNEERFTYDPKDNVLTASDASGAVTSFVYDENNLLTAQTDALGNTTRFEYDALNQLVRTILPDHSTQTQEYDFRGLVVRQTNGLGDSVTFQYDNAGNLLESTDAQGNSTVYEYDSLDRLIKETDALGNVTRYSYDALGNIKEIQDARGNSTQMNYDLLNRLIETIYPDGSRENISYDAAGNVSQFQDRLRRNTVYSYDALNQITQRTFANGSVETFTYDEMGNVLTQTNSAGTIQNEYDLLGRLTATTDVFSKRVDYAYDALGNRKSLSSIIGTGGLRRTYTYDILGRLTGVEDEKLRQAQYEYDALSRRTSKTLANGTRTEYSYDSASQITSIQHKDAQGLILRELEYVLDSRGLVAQKDDSLEGQSGFDYDQLGWLISVTNPVIGATTFALDALGNREDVTSNLGTTQYTTNSLNEYTVVGDEVLEYDANGNLVKRRNVITGNQTFYEYDMLDQLVKITLPGGSQIQYVYDAQGRKVAKTAAGVTTRYLWDGDELLAELDVAGNLLASYVHGPEVDEVLHQEDSISGETLYFHQDELMSTLALTDESGSIKESYSYDAYGNLTSAPQNPSTNFLYTGREFEEEAGLYYNRARFYDPRLGRFINTDPKGYEAGLNLYTYADNNPLAYRDPYGLDPYHGGGGGRGRGGKGKKGGSGGSKGGGGDRGSGSNSGSGKTGPGSDRGGGVAPGATISASGLDGFSVSAQKVSNSSSGSQGGSGSSSSGSSSGGGSFSSSSSGGGGYASSQNSIPSSAMPQVSQPSSSPA
ncbi:MAG: RHS repeat protein, partial [Candidatus Omnitrophica bacterium]|nr:RHS repeat protein [Candidatus Omnitrophota bacterium]